MIYVVSGLAILIFILIVSSVKIVPPGAVFIVERMGSFYAVYTEGVHFSIPFLDRITAKVSTADQRLPVENVTALSSDERPLTLSAEVCFCVADAERFFYSTENTVSSLGRLTLTALRDIVSAMDAETVLASKEDIGKKAARVTAPAVDKWGLLVKEIRLTELSDQ
ncbi:SPFH domain / Band 7 family protein [Ruminococcaceae bacterium FB2012]|nr:SPFH domain / Band 7 family protein [Ruminococcaceae bacterium FB2012]